MSRLIGIFEVEKLLLLNYEKVTYPVIIWHIKEVWTGVNIYYPSIHFDLSFFIMKIPDFSLCAKSVSMASLNFPVPTYVGDMELLFVGKYEHLARESKTDMHVIGRLISVPYNSYGIKNANWVCTMFCLSKFGATERKRNKDF